MNSEQTPLLQPTAPRHIGLADPVTSTSYPSLADGLSRISTVPIGLLSVELLALPVEESANVPDSLKPDVRVAYSLALLLHLRAARLESQAGEQDVYSRWSHKVTCESEVESLDRHLQNIWNAFLANYQSEEDIDCVLWSSFPAANAKRVVDFLVKPDAPAVLSTHPVVEAALDRRWKQGKFYSKAQHPIPSFVRRVEAKLATPWALHFLTMASHFVYFILLAHYLLHPPDRVTTQLNLIHGGRHLALLIFLVASVVSRRSADRPLAVVTLLIFSFALPQIPQPGDGYFELLLFITGIYIFRFHLPKVPSLALITPSSRTLPLAIFMLRNMDNTVHSWVFYGPALFVSVILFSYSMDQDTYFPIPSIPSANTPLLAYPPAPSQTRYAFFTIATLTLLILIFNIFISTVIVSVSNSPPATTGGWDRFGPAIGREARVLAYSACAQFDDTYVFPPPFNVFYITLVAPFEYASRVFGLSERYDRVIRVYVWRVTVLPFLFPVYLISKLLL
ncbi:hypothetical protein FA15DRAFT_662627 [Coprinopsis marcescibilis]|uniref:Uncharacterized protein n=1 Tax=Coprinopsis marcescibilis TaxID=230819 RepID=A0A5C3LCY1_COPMA|nr:hypothetical protein FA15DRAFT_662627 [Coprinopsis marcescibilis]